jgi:hypothetical protein
MTSTYQWIIDRARAGEPVPLDTTRRDMNKVVDFLLSVDGRGITLQDDSPHNLLWVVRGEGR